MRRFIVSTQIALGMYDEALSTYNEIERHLGADTINNKRARLIFSQRNQRPVPPILEGQALSILFRNPYDWCNLVGRSRQFHDQSLSCLLRFYLAVA